MFTRVLIANRGEIAVRVARTCKDLGVATVAVYSDPDTGARHTRACDDAVHLPGATPADTYLNIAAIVEAASSSGAVAIHPGYGFLSENASFAEAVTAAGLTWIGPPAEVLRAAGDKISARRIAQSADVPVVPGLLEAVDDPSVVVEFGAQHGYPIAVKATGGGGGRGLKVAEGPEDVPDAFTGARREAKAYFGDDRVYIERYLAAPKHLEVQIVAPDRDHGLWLGVRDCSMQRRHQKLIEETPPAKFAQLVPEMGKAALALASAMGYVNVGTVEMLVDGDDYFFLEVNARLQVEHTITEEVFGVDLVAAQLRIAAGEELGWEHSTLQSRGHAIECRINAEDPARGFTPTPGTLTRYTEPSGPGVRVDSGYEQGDQVPASYDSLLAKIVCHGSDREEARRRMLRALRETEIAGVSSTIPAHLLLLETESFVAGSYTTTSVEEGATFASLLPAEPEPAPQGVLLVQGQPVKLWNRAMSSSATSAVPRGPSSREVIAPMQGTVSKVWVIDGDSVKPGDPLIVVEAMKMETTIDAGRGGTVGLKVAPGDTVLAGQLLVVIE